MQLKNLLAKLKTKLSTRPLSAKACEKIMQTEYGGKHCADPSEHLLP